MGTSLEQAIREKTAVVGVIGLGYVGLPLIRAFIAAGYRTMGFDVDAIEGRAAVGRPELHRPHLRRVDRPVHRQQDVHAHGRHAAAGRSRRAVDLRSHAAFGQPRSRSDLHRSHGPADRRRAAARPIDRAGKHHLSRHHARRGAADPGRSAG